MENPKHKWIHSVWDTGQQHITKQRSAEGDDAKLNQLLANIFCPGPTYFYTIDFSERRILYFSPNVEEILGRPAEGLSIDDLIDIVHPDDLGHVQKCEAKIMHFFEHPGRAELTKYKFNYFVRLRRSDGKYRSIMHQALTLSVDGFGRIAKVLNIHTDITHFGWPVNPRLSVIGLEGEPSWLGVDVSKPGFLDEPARPFSPRELEVIRLLADGLTAEQVAEILGLSTSTVRTHRKNILQKSDCPNMTAVVAKCIREGLV